MDGVTAALDLEGGTVDVDSWYAAQTGKRLIHYGAAVSHVRARRILLEDPKTAIVAGPLRVRPNAVPSKTLRATNRSRKSRN